MYFNYYQNGRRLTDTSKTITSLTISLHTFTTTPPCSPVSTPTATVPSPSKIPSDRIKPKRKRRMKHMIEIKRCYVKIPKLNPGWNFIGLLALSQVPREMLQFYPI